MPQIQSQPEWVKSSLSFANGNSVEVANLGPNAVGVRDSKDPSQPYLVFDRDEWVAFIGGVHRGEFDDYGRTA